MLEGILGILDSLGFQATAWGPADAPRIMLQLIARLSSDCTFAIADLTSSRFAGLATGPFADLIGQYQFKLTRSPATPAIGQWLFTASVAAPTQSWTANSLIVADSPLDTARLYQVNTPSPGGGLLAGQIWPVTVTALAAGSDGNIAPNNTTLSFVTPLVGVAITNPPQPPTTPANTWLTTPGADAETDGPTGRYNARMLKRWDRLTYGNTDGAYTGWVLEALPAVTRLSVRESDTVEGGVHIVCATAVGGLDAGQIAVITAFLTGATDGVGRRPINDILEVVSANQVTTPPLNLTIYVRSPFAADAVARVGAALQTFLGLLPIGGEKIGNSSVGKVLLADLYKTVMAQQGLLNVVFDITSDIPLGSDDIYAAAPSATMVVQQ